MAETPKPELMPSSEQAVTGEVKSEQIVAEDEQSSQSKDVLSVRGVVDQAEDCQENSKLLGSGDHQESTALSDCEGGATDIAEAGNQMMSEESNDLTHPGTSGEGTPAIPAQEAPAESCHSSKDEKEKSPLDQESVSSKVEEAVDAENQEGSQWPNQEPESLVAPPIVTDDDSCQSGPTSEGNASSPQKRTRVTTSRLMLQSLPQGVGADSLFEYSWPIDDTEAEYWMLQEQVSAFLDVKSFRRKYPDLERRQIDIEERNYLTSCGAVTEMQCDLGLTALKSEDISDLMLQDYPEKYEEYAKVVQKREEQRLAKRHQDMQDLQNITAPAQTAVSKMDMKKLMEKAARSAANYNAMLARERREERRHYYDIPTSIVHYPMNRKRPLPPELTQPSVYPVALLRGQFSDTYSKYSSNELKYLPVKTALYEPPLRIHNSYMPLPPVEEDNSQVLNPMHLTATPTQLAGTTTAAGKRNTAILTDGTCALCGRQENKSGSIEKCLRCTECHRETHPTCCELTDEMLAVVLRYNWMCMECKVCVRCSDPGNEDKMIVCDNCDRGYHTFCVGLKSIPEESIWACPECTASS